MAKSEKDFRSSVEKSIFFISANPVRHSNHRDDSTVLRHLYYQFFYVCHNSQGVLTLSSLHQLPPSHFQWTQPYWEEGGENDKKGKQLLWKGGSGKDLFHWLFWCFSFWSETIFWIESKSFYLLSFCYFNGFAHLSVCPIAVTRVSDTCRVLLRVALRPWNKIEMTRVCVQ